MNARATGQIIFFLIAGAGAAYLVASRETKPNDTEALVKELDAKAEAEEIVIPAEFSISGIMSEMHQKRSSLVGRAAKYAKEERWEDAKKLVAPIKANSAALGRQKPNKGSEESWKAKTDEYKANAEAIADGLEKKDAKAVQVAEAGLNKCCNGCHTAHK